MRQLRWIIPVLVIAALGTFVAWQRGVKVVIHNNGAATMREIRVVVTGRSYGIGDLAPGESRSTRVNPEGASHIVVHYADASGTKRRVPVDCYFESGNSGRIAVHIRDGLISKVDDQIRTRLW